VVQESSILRWRRSSLEIKKCKKCGRYTFQDDCPECGGEAVSPHPAKFSPEDKYGEYRRKLKRKEMGIEG